MTDETLADLETRMRALHARHVADAPPRQAKYWSAQELADFEAKHLGPVPYQPAALPTERRQNVWPRPVAAPEGRDAFTFSDDEMRSFEAAHGLYSAWR